MSDTMQVGTELVELCRAGKFREAIDTLYSPNVVSIEPRDFPHVPARVEGIEAVRQKNIGFLGAHEIHKIEILGPFPNADRFIVHYKLEVTAKAGPMAGKRMPIEEAALYTVKDGKILKDEFFSVGEG